MLARRPGNFAVVTLIAVIAMTATVSAITNHFKASIETAGEATGVALARMQVLYLAEMGVNEALFRANLDPAGPHPVVSPLDLDFKDAVALVRDDPAGLARVQVGPADASAGRPPFRALATLRCAAGSFTEAVYFDVARAAAAPPGRTTPQWTLARYLVDPPAPTP